MCKEVKLLYVDLEPVCAAFYNPSWNVAASQEDGQKASQDLQIEIENEIGLPVGFNSVGTGAAAPGFEVVIPSAIISGALFLFFKGKEVQPNIDAWKELYKRYITPLLKRRPSFDRGGAFVLAILELRKQLSCDPTSVKLLSYRKSSVLRDEEAVQPASDGCFDDRDRIQVATIHIYKVEIDGSMFQINVSEDKVSTGSAERLLITNQVQTREK